MVVLPMTALRLPQDIIRVIDLFLKHPKSPYLIFCKEMRTQVEARLFGTPKQGVEIEILRCFGTMWKTLPENEINKYREKAKLNGYKLVC